MIRFTAYLAAMVATAQGAQALTLAECTRTTHISHAGEAFHEDLGQGRVMWLDWWSQEGSAKDIMVVDCAPGDAVRFRVSEENMSSRIPFDRTRPALKILRDIEAGNRAFATLDRIGDAVSDEARDVARLILATAPCACDALYPELRGAKAPFVFEKLPDGFGQAKK